MAPTLGAVTGYEVFVVALAMLGLIVLAASAIAGFIARFTRKVPPEEHPRRRRPSKHR